MTKIWHFNFDYNRFQLSLGNEPIVQDEFRKKKLIFEETEIVITTKWIDRLRLTQTVVVRNPEKSHQIIFKMIKWGKTWKFSFEGADYTFTCLTGYDGEFQDTDTGHKIRICLNEQFDHHDYLWQYGFKCDDKKKGMLIYLCVLLFLVTDGMDGGFAPVWKIA